MNCQFCEKIFSLKSNLVRHEKTCKLNPEKETKPKMTKDQILEELEMMKKVLNHRLNNKIVDAKLENKVVDENFSPFKKDKYLLYVERRYSNALNTKDCLMEINNLLTMEQYKLIALKTYVFKYKAVLDLLFKSLPKERRPFVILKHTPYKEVGYIKINEKFYKFEGRELYNELFTFITGRGMVDWFDKCKGIQGILISKNCQLKIEDEKFFTQEEDGFATSVISILGTSYDETEVQLKRAREEICQHIINSCIILQE